MLAAALFLKVLLASVVTASPVLQTGLQNATIANVRSNLLSSASASWELGAAAEALTEMYWPSLSVFRSTAFPPPTHLDASDNASDVFAIAKNTVQSKSASSQPLISGDGAVGDPASIGVAVLLANWTGAGTNFGTAAEDQLNYLLYTAPHTSDGAISQRDDQVQLWADFVYMAPPFIAYYGMLQGGNSGLKLMTEAYTQCKLYRKYLKDASGLWRHVTLGSWQDNTHWGTGNGWAAAGMLRVLETLQNSGQASSLTYQTNDLKSWINEILDATWTLQKANGTLYNVLDSSSSFADSSSTALLASVTFRMAYLTNDSTHITSANRALQLINNSVDNNGWLTNTVDPYTFNTPNTAGNHSPEGQAFVLLLQAAWRDYSIGQSKRR